MPVLYFWRCKEMVLKDKIQVDSLKTGAKWFGGATQIASGEIYSYTAEASRIVCSGEAEVKFYIPMVLGITEETTRMTAILVGMNSGFFKGDFTTERAVGSWVNRETNVVHLDNLLILSFKSDYSKIDCLIKYAKELGIVFGQERIAFEFNEYMVVV